MDRARVVCGVLVCAAALVACGARTLAGDLGDGGARPEPSDTSARGGSGSPAAQSGSAATPEATEDASAPTLFDVCPPDPPQIGRTCPSPNLGCAYFDANPGTCQAFLCNGAGIWQTGPQGC